MGLVNATNKPQDCKTNACISPERAFTGEANMSNKPVVRAKMRCNSVTKTGSERHPNVNVQLGAVFSNDPESENRSFAQATPSASVSINIDPGRAAASSFELGGEYYVDFTPCGIPERRYIGDGIAAMAEVVVLTDREGTKFLPATYDGRTNVLIVEIDGVTYTGSPYGLEILKTYGYTHWMYSEE